MEKKEKRVLTGENYRATMPLGGGGEGEVWRGGGAGDEVQEPWYAGMSDDEVADAIQRREAPVDGGSIVEVPPGFCQRMAARYNADRAAWAVSTLYGSDADGLFGFSGVKIRETRDPVYGRSKKRAQVAHGGWIPLAPDSMPPAHCGYILVTNNVDARDAFGKSSHVWLTTMVHVHPSRRVEKHPLTGTEYTYAEAGEITAYAHPGDWRIRNLTHWRPALPEEFDR